MISSFWDDIFTYLEDTLRDYIVKFVLGYLCNSVRSEDSRKKILRSHICLFFIYIMRNNIEVYSTIGGELWEVEAEYSSKLRVSSTLDEHWF